MKVIAKRIWFTLAAPVMALYLLGLMLSQVWSGETDDEDWDWWGDE